LPLLSPLFVLLIVIQQESATAVAVVCSLVVIQQESAVDVAVVLFSCCHPAGISRCSCR
jgi:hypothetical protein